MFTGSRSRPRALAALLVAFAGLAGAAGAAAQARASETPAFTARYDPRLRFRTFSTRGLHIHFHEEAEHLASRLLRVARQVMAELEPSFGLPRGELHVILVDQADEANGWATVLPYNTIEISAAPPRAHSLIGNSDDWLRLVFTHEYTHVLHLEKSGGWLGSLRHVFGRLPLFYPNLALPLWQVEGLATFTESAVTGRGRVPAGDFRMILDRAAAAGRYAPLDRANGGVIDWPSGQAPYVYGAYFHKCLADRYGAASLSRLAKETASRPPFFGSRAFGEVYGKSLGRLWDECRADFTPRSPSAGPATRLTHHGFTVTSPAFRADGRLFYSVSNPHGFPALMEWRSGSHPREVTTRVRGNRMAATATALVFDQHEVVAEVDTQSDIYAASPDDGRTRRLTRHARAADPDVAPDGRTVVCVVQTARGRTLATFSMPPEGRLATPVALVAEDDVDYASPRWSPDGRTLVAERQRPGGPSELVLVDVATRQVRTLVASAPARNVTPAWLPDGTGVLFASDRDGRPFALYVADIESGSLRRVAAGVEGAVSPAIAPDGRRIVFVGYSAEGYDLYEVPIDRAAPSPEPEAVAAVDMPSAPIAGDVVPRPAPYSPWPTLRPRFWTPVVESSDDDVLVGAATAGYDALGRHGIGAAVAWAFERRRAEWQIDYTYARWRPALFASASQDLDRDRAGAVVAVREVNVGALLPTRRVRWSMASLAAFHVSDARVRRSALRGGWSVSSAKSFGYSVSAEQGGAVSVTAEFTRRGLGADGNATAVAAEGRGYVRAFPRHGVIAARLAGAAATGDERVRRRFTAGGSGSQRGGFDFDADAIGLLRGFEASDLFGDRAAVVNIDYRLPLAWIERGIGTLPVLLRSIHGAIFADAGHAWEDRLRAGDLRRSVGAELSFDVVLGYALPVTIATGVAWRGGGGRHHRGAAVFARLGRAF